MPVLDTSKLPNATFKDFPFLWQNSNINIGARKTVSHKYPDSSNRSVEDLGGENDDFTIVAVIDYSENFSVRNNFINILKEEGSGLLVLPIGEPKEVTVVGKPIINDSKASLGITTFTITFEESEKNRFPISVQGSSGLISNIKDEVLEQNTSFFTTAWSDVTDSKTKFDASVSKVTNTINDKARGIRKLATNIRSSADGFSELATSLNTIIQSVNTLVQSPSDLALSYQTALTSFEAAYDNAIDTFNSISQLLGFTAGDEEIIETGNIQAEKMDNQDLINNIISTNALVISYNQAVNIDYNNTDELNQNSTTLENGFLALDRDAIDDDIYDNILTIRKESNDIFKNLAIGLPKVTNLNIKNSTPLAVLVYNLYGSLDRIDEIEELNSFLDTSDISGDIKILSNV